MQQRTLTRDIAATLRGYWDDGGKPQRILLATGTILVGVGLAHLVPALVADRPWTGPISFRKPFLFGVSFGLTCLVVGWLLAYLRIGRRAQWTLAAMLGGGSVVEVALVALQAWRGVPSHFNVTTGAFNNAVFNAMGVSVSLIAVAILLTTVWSLYRLDAPAPLRLGIRAGLVLLLVSQGLGAHMVTHGLEQVTAQTGQEPNILGAAGMLKVPHAVTIHAAQVLPGIAWLLGFSRWPVGRQQATTAMATAGYAGIVGVAVLQTFSGRAPVDLSAGAGVLLVVSVAALAGAGVATVAALADRRRSETPLSTG